MFVWLSIAVLFAVGASNASPSVNLVNELDQFEYITDEFIQKINVAQDSWTAGHNFPQGTKFSDLKILLGTKRQEELFKKYLEVKDDIVIPKSFDARKHWPYCKSIREIKNQGHCGSCWAVSSATTMSDRLCISTKGKFNSDISAQKITSCSPGNGCHGGWPYNAWKYFVEHGAPTGGDFHSNKGCQPYLVKPCINRTVSYGGKYNLLDESEHPEQCAPTDYVKTPACSSKCFNHYYHKSYRNDLHYGKDAYYVPNNVTQIQLHILKYGPVVADFTVYKDFLTYKSDFSSPFTSAYEGESYLIQYEELLVLIEHQPGVYEHKLQEPEGGHAIRILGWGEENGNEYWIVANQWGKEWGQKGVVKFRRGINECGIEEDVVSGITG